MVTNVNAFERIAALLAGVLALFAVAVAPSLAWPSAEEPTATGVQASADIELDIFSGRPNPRWTIAAGQIAPLLPEADAQPLTAREEPPGLGYRGFLITYVSAETDVPAQYRVYAGTVSISTGEEQTAFGDTKGLEQWLIEDARGRGYGDLLQGAPIPPVSGDTASE